MTQTIIAATIAGAAFGFAYFAMVRRTAMLFAQGEGWLGAAALTFGRLTAAIVFFGLIARLGAEPLLAAFAGFLGGRMAALRAARRTG
jgi:hypothetical protein